MPFDLEIPVLFRDQGWKVKIRDKERLEPPHASILFKTKAWRIGLRDRVFLDSTPSSKGVPKKLLDHVFADEAWDELCRQWDLMYPNNPVGGDEDEL
jgi:hypothetical protein